MNSPTRVFDFPTSPYRPPRSPPLYPPTVHNRARRFGHTRGYNVQPGEWGGGLLTIIQPGEWEPRLNAVAEIYYNANGAIRRISTHQLAGHVNNYTDPVAAFKKGGKIPKSGLYKLHKGEVVVPANRVKTVDKALKKAGRKPLKKVCNNCAVKKKRKVAKKIKKC